MDKQIRKAYSWIFGSAVLVFAVIFILIILWIQHRWSVNAVKFGSNLLLWVFLEPFGLLVSFGYWYAEFQRTRSANEFLRHAVSVLNGDYITLVIAQIISIIIAFFHPIAELAAYVILPVTAGATTLYLMTKKYQEVINQNKAENI